MGLAERNGPVGRACGAAVTGFNLLELQGGRRVGVGLLSETVLSETIKFLVRWQDLDTPEDDTWEDEENILDRGLIEEFDAASSTRRADEEYDAEEGLLEI